MAESGKRLPGDMNDLRINAERLWQRLMSMAEIGATPAGGCNRQALTDLDAAGRDVFVDWCRAAGCEIRLDSIGNLFARRAGRDAGAAPVLTGSHLDTQPTGGKFDGVYGVLAGLEVIETLNDHQMETDYPIELVVWTNEEGCRFDCAMMGSAVWAGNMPLAQAYALRDGQGISVEAELSRTNQKGPDRLREQVHAAFELHIEQGPVLEAENKAVGVVTGVQNMCRYRISIQGQETHAGPSPMKMRRDPMMAVGRILPDLYQVADDHSPHGRVTFGYVHATPGSPNTVPREVELTLDLRHPQEASFESMIAAAETIIDKHCKALGLDAHFERVWQAPGVRFDLDCVQAVQKATEVCGYESMQLVSGAGHDACNVSSVAPTAMIFIPCDGGLSHNEHENISPVQAEAGANVLLQAILSMSCEG